jgi:streptogramin lyase
VLRESTMGFSIPVVAPAAGTAYALVAKTNTPMQGPWVLRRTDLRSGAVRRGPTFPVGGLTMASGYLWIYGPPGAAPQPVISQVNPVTLARVRSIPLAPVPASSDGQPLTVAAGPGDSVWIGSDQTLLRVSASTGVGLTRVRLPPGLAVSDISMDPAGRNLYASAAHVVSGGIEGNQVLEYDARSGRRLATAASGLITYSVAGAALTAVPGGVWASFRTGMLGLTIHLRQQDLAQIAPPEPGITWQPATGVFHWPMDATTLYGGGALWLANQAGIVACLDPRTGEIRASEHVRQSQLIYQLLAVNPELHAIYALNTSELLQITPPRRCWS